MLVRIAPWMPDRDSLEGVASEALGVIPTLKGFRPHPSFASTATAITARAQGAASFRALDGTIHNFCGDATKLYKMASGGASWSDVSRVAGGAYATPTDGWWQFVQFGNVIKASNGFDAMQSYTLGTSTNFAAAAGTPPIASFLMVVKGFVVALRVSTAWNRVHWSGIEDSEDWVASATTLSDTQDIPDGGAIMGGLAGEFALIFQERQIVRMSFEGPPTAFRFDKVTDRLGAKYEGSIAGYSNLGFFWSDEGFKMIRGGVEIIDIGDEQVDRWAESMVDAAYPYRITSCVDPINKLYKVGFPSSGASGTPDVILQYHWPTGKWSHLSQSHELLCTMASQSGYTLETLDTPMPSIDAGTISLDSRYWSGSGRLLAAMFNTSHAFGFFDGSYMAATVESSDAQLIPGRKALLKQARPVIEGTSVSPSMVIGKRNHLHEAVTYGSSIPINSQGFCRTRVKSRYHRFRLTAPAASVWTHAIGADDIEAAPMGKR